MYIFIILAGAFISSRVNLSELLTKNLSKIQSGCLLLLLFVMGVNIGINDEIISTFGKLGLQAVVLALCSIVLSVGAVKLVGRYYRRREKEEQNEH